MKIKNTFSSAVILIALTIPTLSQAKPAEGCGLKVKDSFAKRFYKTYKEHLAWTGENVPPLEHDAYTVDAPLTSPPAPKRVCV